MEIRVESVVFVIGDLGPGGSERQLFFLCESMIRQSNIRPVVVNWGGGEMDFFHDKFVDIGAKVIVLGRYSKIVRLFKLILILKRLQPTVVHSFSFYLNFPVFCCGFFSKTKTYGSLRSSYGLLAESSSQLSRLLNVILCSEIITNSLKAKDELIFYYPFKSKKIHFLPNHTFVSKEDFAGVGSLEIFQNLRTTSVGRCDENKRIDLLILVIKALKERGSEIVHSHLGDGVLIDELRSKVDAFGLHESFLFLGNVPNVSEYLRNSDMLFHAAISEGSPNAIIEAMAEGLVTVTSDCGDVKQIVDDGVNGFIISELDFVNSFCYRILELENDCDKRALIGRNARKMIQTKFNTDHYFIRARKIYNI